MRPTISLAAILKNEAKNLPRFLSSVDGCFDEIHLTDTGSTDESIEIIKEHQKKNPKLFLHHFKWCDDFAKARNASFDPVKTDYVMWLDLDDVLSDKEAFISWRDSVMKLSNFWLATYHYALAKDGKPACSFARERVFRTDLKLDWRYFVHEGIVPKEGCEVNYASTWAVKHLRDDEDLKKDRSRNLAIFERHKGELDARMRYYYGKELFENGKPLEAFAELMEAVSATSGIELHDRIMGVQYAAMCAMQLNQNEKAVQLAHRGLELSPTRAEFFIVIADSLLKAGKAVEAIPYYTSATKCQFGGDNPVQGAIFQHKDSYSHYPLHQLTRIYANMGNMDEAERTLDRAMELGATEETMGLKGDLKNLRDKVGDGKKPRIPTDDIVISTPPHKMYDWDHGVYETRGIGGSETAAVKMASWLSALTGRRVIIFNPRDEAKRFGKVEYRPTTTLPEYFRDYSPALHIAWRHTMKISEDPMYVWCHDLMAPGMEHPHLYEKVLALSNFHADFLTNLCRVPREKIHVTKNGIDPIRFLGLRAEKEFGKIVYTSSPDRGLERAIEVMERVVKIVPEAKLHVYYGFHNMEKMGKTKEVEAYKKLLDRPFVVFHGNLPQRELTLELQTACVWLYPTTFLETYCISAVEMLCSKVYPVVRAWGALPETLKNAPATILDHDSKTDCEIEAYANEVVRALREKKWEEMNVNPEHYSWRKVAEEWVDYFGLKKCQSQTPDSNSSQSRLTA